MAAATTATKNDVNLEDKGKAESAFARSQLYRLLSLGFYYPREDFLSVLNNGSFIEDLKKYFSFILANAAKVPEKAEGQEKIIEERIDETMETLEVLEGLMNKEFKGKDLVYLQDRYIKVFSHGVAKNFPPLGTHYGTEHTFQKSSEMGDIAGFYNAFGLETSDKEKGEALDHISIELEFMYVVTFKEGHALENHGVDKAEICVKAQKKFFKTQIGSWGPLFAKLIIKHSDDEFYKKFATLLRLFMEMEAAYLKVKPRRLKAPMVTDSLDESDRRGGEGMECDMGAIKDSRSLLDSIKT